MKPQISERARRVPASPIRKLMPLADEAKRRGIHVYHLNIGQPDIPTPPVMLDAFRNHNLTVLEYGHSGGLWEYRQNLAQYYTRLGLAVGPEQLIITTAGSEAITFAVLNIAGLGVAVVTGHWYLKQIYQVAYFPVAGSIWVLGALGRLPRVKVSTRGEGHERRYFYGSVWAVCWAQPVLWLMWRALPQSRAFDLLKLAVFIGILAFVGHLARLGRLPRTRPIVPGELAVSD